MLSHLYKIALLTCLYDFSPVNITFIRTTSLTVIFHVKHCPWLGYSLYAGFYGFQVEICFTLYNLDYYI